MDYEKYPKHLREPIKKAQERRDARVATGETRTTTQILVDTIQEFFAEIEKGP